MKTRQFILGSLRVHLKAQQLTYKDTAQSLEVSEQTEKRMVVQQNCSLERLERIGPLIPY